MTTDARKLLESDMSLPAGDRAGLAARLIESLDSDSVEETRSAWDAEVSRRIAELDHGSVAPIPHSEAILRIKG
ncbi:Putative addiction module component [Phycisphaerae bacterium RAS2]|nr:Putative addiction module component [Phycisphaerae bacterium RAS2]